MRSLLVAEGGGRAAVAEGGGRAAVAEGGGRAVAEGGGRAAVAEGGGRAVAEGGGRAGVLVDARQAAVARSEAVFDIIEVASEPVAMAVSRQDVLALPKELVHSVVGVALCKFDQVCTTVALVLDHASILVVRDRDDGLSPPRSPFGVADEVNVLFFRILGRIGVRKGSITSALGHF